MKAFSIRAAVLASLAALAACAAPQEPAPDLATQSGTFQHQLTYAAGLKNIPNVVQASNASETALATSAAMTVTTAISPVGVMNVGSSLGFGLIGFLAAPPPGIEAKDRLIVLAPPSVSKESIERKAQDVGYKLADGQLRSLGYQPVQDPAFPHQQVYIKPGCQLDRNKNYDTKCSAQYRVTAVPKSTLNGKQVYMMAYGGGDIMAPYAPYIPSSGADRAKKITDALDGMGYFYIAPAKVEGAWTRPMLYHGGKLMPL